MIPQAGFSMFLAAIFFILHQNGDSCAYHNCDTHGQHWKMMNQKRWPKALNRYVKRLTFSQ
ncbi:hypothetical protein ABD75_18145 [Bacillus vallismortis]|nr:hypothetical protein [Bacillus vallismortis]QAV10615.1 hypothetical protein BV11031_19705 [Bacillus vallismortis]